MKQRAIVLLICSLFMIFSGAVLAVEINSVISAVDASKGLLTLKDGSQFDGVAATLLKGFRAGDDVKVEY